MWLYLDAARFEGIAKITGISANYRGEYSYINITYNSGDIHCMKFDNEDQCREFFQDLLHNLNNPNKILQYGHIEDL